METTKTVPVTKFNLNELLTSVYATQVATTNFEFSISYVSDEKHLFAVITRASLLPDADWMAFIGNHKLRHFDFAQGQDQHSIVLRIPKDGVLPDYGAVFCRVFMTEADGLYTGSHGCVWRFSGGGIDFLTTRTEDNPLTSDEAWAARNEMVEYITAS